MRAAVLLDHIEIKGFSSHNHLWSLSTELQFSGWELAPTGKTNKQWLSLSHSQHHNNIIMVLVAMEKFHLQWDDDIWTQRNVRNWPFLLYVFLGVWDLRRSALPGSRDGVEVCTFLYKVLSFHIPYVLINRSVQPSASSPSVSLSVSQVSQWARLCPQPDAW